MANCQMRIAADPIRVRVWPCSHPCCFPLERVGFQSRALSFPFFRISTLTLTPIVLLAGPRTKLYKDKILKKVLSGWQQRLHQGLGSLSFS